MNDDINSIFQEYLSANADKESIDFGPLLQKYPQHKEGLTKKVKAYKKLLSVLRDEQPEKEVPLLVGREIGSCKLIKVLGQGGMGVVYLGRQEKLGRDVVVKVLRPFAVDNKALKERFLRESRIIGRLNHKNIVPVYDVGEQESSFYIIMRYIEGTPLNILIEKFSKTDQSASKLKEILGLETKTPTEFLCNLIIQIADAVQYAHDHGGIHRDIKPSNIIVETNGNRMLLDFGLSHDDVEKNLTVSGEFMGTPIYSAPESFQKQVVKDSHQLDVYSLGVTLYELLTGGLPYEGDSIYEIYTNIKNKEPIRPKNKWKHIPRDLETIISTAIAKDPQLRYQSVKLLRDDLQNFLNYLPIKAKSPSIIKRAFYYTRRKKRFVIITGAAIFMGGIAVGTYYLMEYQKMRQMMLDISTAVSKGNVDEGINTLKNLTTLYPNKAEYWYLLGALQQGSGHFLEAIKSMNKAIRIEDNVDYYSILSSAYLYSGNIELAETTLKKALAKNPDDAIPMKGLIDIFKNQFSSATSTYKKIAQNQKNGFVVEDETNQYLAFDYSALAMLALLFKEMDYKNIAEKYIREAINQTPYNTSLYKILEQLPLSNLKRTKLKNLFNAFGDETLSILDHDIEFTVPCGWRQNNFQRMSFGQSTLAAYSGVETKPKDTYPRPTILLFSLKNSNNLQAEAYILIDRMVVQFNGGVIKRDVETIRNDPIKKFRITTDITLPFQQLRAKVLIVQKGGKAYMIVGYAPKEIFVKYEKDISATMNSVRFTNSKEWRTYSPPYKSYSVKMPSTPSYWQGSFKGNGNDESVTNQHVLASDTVVSMSKYSVTHIELDMPLNEEDQKKRFSDVMETLRTKGKILSTDQLHENGILKFKSRVKWKTNVISDIRVFFIGTNAYYLMTTGQDTNNEDNEKFFSSFQEIGNPINVGTVFETVIQKTPSETKSWQELLKGAIAGNMKDQNEIGKFYLNLNSRTEQDLTEAFKWFKKAADQNYPNAINNIGIMFDNGWSVQENRNDAKKWYLKAANLGLHIAQYNLAFIIFNDATKPEDFAEAMKWFHLSAKNGNDSAAYKLGQIYEDGAPGIPINYKEADYWYGKAFE